MFSLLFIMTSLQVSYASEKAFAVMTSYGLEASDLVTVVKKYPELQDMDIAEDIQSFAEDQSHYILKLYAEKTNDVYVLTKSETQTDIKKFSIPFDMEIKTIQGDIHGTLFETLMKETSSVRISQQMADAFSDDFTTTKGLRVNASYSLDVIQYYDNGRFIKYGSILKANLIIGHAMSNKVLQMDPATNEWALLSDNLLTSDKPFYAPVRSRRVSSLFQLNRRHPVTRRHQPHNGIDFAASKGTAVYPALEGEVIVIARTRSKGKFITIRHDNGFETTYIHLNKFQKGLRVGMTVGLEDQIGEVGRTGYATGPHLHFGVIKDGYFINPIYLVKNYCYDQKDQFENLGFESEDAGIPDAEIPVNDSEE